MADLVFTGVAEAPPVDLDGGLFGWTVSGPFPAVADGERYPAQDYTGSSGWRLQTSEFNGFSSLTVSATMAADWGALDGAGFVTIAAYGDGGPLASAYHSWAVGLVVVGSTVTVRGQYQDSAGAVQTIDVGSFAVPAATWSVLHVTREERAPGSTWAAYLDGGLVGTASVSDTIAYGQDTLLTLGYLSTLGVASAHFLGRLESISLASSAATAEEVRQLYLARRTREEYRAVVASLLPPLDRERGSNYHALRVRPLADGLGAARARISNWESAALLPTAYGSQLDRWRRSLGLSVNDPRPSSVLQEETAVLFADPASFTIERTRQIGARIMGVDVGDVAVSEPRNRIEPRTTATPDRPVAGPWNVKGDASATYTATGLVLRSRDGVDLRWWADTSRGQECTLACDHRDQAAVIDERVVSGVGFAATLVALSGTSATQWGGFILVGQQRARHIGVYDDGGTLRIASRDTLDRTLGPWTQIATITVGAELAVFWDDLVGEFFVGVNPTPGDPTTQNVYMLPALTTAVIRAGLAIGAEGDLSGDIEAEWTSAVLQWPDAETTRKYFVSTPTPAESDPVSQTAQLRALGRPTTQGHITYTPTAVAADPGSFVGYSELSADLAAEPLPYPDDRQSAHRVLDRPALNLWAFQRAGAPLDDRIRGTRLWEPAGSSVAYEQDGPDLGRYAVSLANGVSSYLETQDPAFQDTSGGSVGAIVVFRRTGLPGTLLRKADLFKSITVRATGLSDVQVAISDGGPESTVTRSVASGQWVVFGFYVFDNGNVALATPSGVTVGAFGVGSVSSTGSWTVGDSTVSADASFRMVAWHSLNDSAELLAAVQYADNALL